MKTAIQDHIRHIHSLPQSQIDTLKAQHATQLAKKDTIIEALKTQLVKQETTPDPTEIVVKRTRKESNAIWDANHPEQRGKTGCVARREEFWKAYLKKYHSTPHYKCRSLLGRISDSRYHMVKALLQRMDATNPKWTKEDQEAICKIFDIPNNKTCIITGSQNGIGIGDHVYEICSNYHQKLMIGSNHPCNLLPVIGSLNASYKKFPGENKKFKCSGKSKNIGMEELTEEEKKEISPGQLQLYNKFQKRKEYLKKRKFKDHHLITEKTVEIIERTLKNMYAFGGPLKEFGELLD